MFLIIPYELEYHNSLNILQKSKMVRWLEAKGEEKMFQNQKHQLERGCRTVVILVAGSRVQELMGLRHPNLSIKDIIWLLNHDSIIPREVLGGVGDLL
jgi:hypothetical protein